MSRAFILGVALLAVACGHKHSDSLCAIQVPPPEACHTSCDPSPGAVVSCPIGYHCSADGKCDTFCTRTGNECGAGYTCTADGNCIADGGGSNDPIIDAADCPVVKFTATPVTPSILLLVDRSTSMNQNFNNDEPVAGNGPYKFPTIRDALVGSQGVVQQFEDAVYFGTTLYTTIEGATSEPQCLLLTGTTRTIKNSVAIRDAITNNPPRPFAHAGYTPTHLAINAAVADFGAHPPPVGSPPVIVLATDGLPNECASTTSRTAEALRAARAAFTAGIKMYILGVSVNGNQTAVDHLKEMAKAGQGELSSAVPYFATSPAQLAAQFQTIIGGIVSCDLKISQPVNATDGMLGHVVLNDTMNLVYGIDWVLDADGITLHLIGNACTVLKSSAHPKVDATFPCGAIIL